MSILVINRSNTQHSPCIVNCLLSMVHFKTFAFCIVFALLWSGCGKRQGDAGNVVALSDLPSVYVAADPDSVIEIRNWLAIGPFTFQPLLTDPARSFFRNDLKRYGIKEGMIAGADVEKLQKRGVGVCLINVPSPQLKLFRYVSGKTENRSNFYLVARIHSAKARETTLIFDGSYSYAAWINGEKLLEVRDKYNVNKAGDRFVNAMLKEGDNMLFVKVGRGTNKRSWDLICAIATPQEGARIFRVNYSGDIVVNPITGNTLEIYAGPYRNGKVELFDSGGKIVSAGSFANLNTNDRPFALPEMNNLQDGFYKAVLTVGHDRIGQTVYKGDFSGFVKKTKAGLTGISTGALYANDLNAAMQRVEYLNGKPKEDPASPDETRFVNRNRVFWGYALYKMSGKNAVTQLMTYNDREDHSGVFIFHHNGNRHRTAPLVIIVPPELQGDSMIEDWYMSNLDQIETDNALADRYGFATAWIYAGGRNYSAVKTEKEISAVIDRLQSECVIDSKSIFIMGDCEGGRRALVQLALSPDRYAACVAASPVTMSGGIDGVPVNLLSQMGNTPILIRHGTDDDVSPVENSRKFYAEAQRLHKPVEYVEVSGSHVNVAKDGHRYVFEYFSRQMEEAGETEK